MTAAVKHWHKYCLHINDGKSGVDVFSILPQPMWTASQLCCRGRKAKTKGEGACREWCTEGIACVARFATKTKALTREIPPATQAKREKSHPARIASLALFYLFFMALAESLFTDGASSHTLSRSTDQNLPVSCAGHHLWSPLLIAIFGLKMVEIYVNEFLRLNRQSSTFNLTTFLGSRM